MSVYVCIYMLPMSTYGAWYYNIVKFGLLPVCACLGTLFMLWCPRRGSDGLMSDGQSAVRQASGRPSWSDYLRMDPTCRQAKSDRWSHVSLCVPYCKPCTTPTRFFTNRWEAYCKLCTTPTRFLETVENRITNRATLPRVFYKPWIFQRR